MTVPALHAHAVMLVGASFLSARQRHLFPKCAVLVMGRELEADVDAGPNPTRFHPHENDYGQRSEFGPIGRVLLTRPASPANAQPSHPEPHAPLFLPWRCGTLGRLLEG